METHLIELPRRILIGNDVVFKLPVMLKGLQLEGNPLVLCGPNTIKIIGNEIIGCLERDFKRIKTRIVEKGSIGEVEDLKKENFDFVVCIGGGRVIDVGKLLAFETKKPFIVVPTAPSHDGIVSERVSLINGDTKYSLRAKPPSAVIADIRILTKAPYKLIASGCADIISNYSAVFDWQLGAKKGEYYSEYAATLALLSSEIVMKSCELIRRRESRGIRNLVQALLASGISMSLVGSSRPASGSEHLFSHALEMERLCSTNASNPSTGEFLPLHGEQCGLGAIISSYMQGQDWERIKNALKSVGAPTTAKELGVSESMIVEALLKAKGMRNRYTILDEKPLDKEKATEVCKKTGVFE